MRYRSTRCRLGDILDQKRMTNRDLAFLTGINESNISAYIHSGRGMTLNTAKTIASALGVTIDDLFEWVRCDDS
jgi:DNA-binding Xre family transcriptional regulator